MLTLQKGRFKASSSSTSIIVLEGEEYLMGNKNHLSVPTTVPRGAALSFQPEVQAA